MCIYTHIQKLPTLLSNLKDFLKLALPVTNIAHVFFGWGKKITVEKNRLWKDASSRRHS